MERMGIDKQLPNSKKAYHTETTADEDTKGEMDKATYTYLLKELKRINQTLEKVEELLDELAKQKTHVHEISALENQRRTCEGGQMTSHPKAHSSPRFKGWSAPTSASSRSAESTP